MSIIYETPQVIDCNLYKDNRGYFFESYNYNKLKTINIDNHFIQDNVSLSANKGTIRGLHFQAPPMDQSKLIIVLSGSILDVVVDIRANSPTYGQIQTVELCSNNPKAFYVPKGYAHGFCTLEENTMILYKVDNGWSKEHELGIIWNDCDLNIPWPVFANDPILSEKDLLLPKLKNLKTPF